MFNVIGKDIVKAFLDAIGTELDTICTRGKSILTMRNEIEKNYADAFYALNGFHIFDYFENSDLLDYIVNRYGFNFYTKHDYISG